MKPRILLVLAILSLPAVAAADSRVSVDLRAGVAVPDGASEGWELDTGAGFDATVAYRLQPHLHAYGGWGWHRFPLTLEATAASLDMEQTGYAMGFRFEHPFSGESSEGLSYRLQVGATYEHLELESGDDLVGDSGHGFGWEGGAGLVVPVGQAWRVTPGARYRSLSRDLEAPGASAAVDLRAFVFDVGVMKRW